MTSQSEYLPSPTTWVRDHVETIEASGDTRSVDMQGLHVVLLTMVGSRSGKARKVPLMRVEHEGVYAAIGSKGGAPEHPLWVANLLANPDIDLMDETSVWQARARLIDGEEREAWWARAVAAFPPYAGYQLKTERQIPVFLLERR